MKIGPFFTLKRGFARVVDQRPGQVGGKQIGGELDAREGHLQRAGQRLDRGGLGEAGHPLEEHVPVGEQGDHQPVDHALLTDDDPAHFAGQPAQDLRFIPHPGVQFGDIQQGDPP